MELLIEDDGVARSAVGIQRISRNRPNVLPSGAAIQRLGGVSSLGVESEEGEASRSGSSFGRLHQCDAESLPAGSPVNQQFRNLGSMGLVRRPRRVDLDCAGYPNLVARDEKHRSWVRCGDGRAPPLLGTVQGEGRKEADRRTSFDGIHEHCGKIGDVGFAGRANEFLDHGTEKETCRL